MLELSITYQGPELAPHPLLAELPEDYRTLLQQVNGFITFSGGLHVRGLCDEPLWHSLEHAWKGPAALCRLYPAVEPGDIPFAQDCVGDQYLLRNGVVHHLWAELGKVESLELDWRGFFRAAHKDPAETLYLAPLADFQTQGGELEPGELIDVQPPFCVDAEVRLYKALPALDRLENLAAFARKVAGMADGEALYFENAP
jgi:hypothetical protein